MEQFLHFMHIFIPLLPQHGLLDVLFLIAPHRVILFIDSILEWISSGCGWEKRGFPLVRLLIVGFPPVFDIGHNFEEWKSNIFLVREIIDRDIPFQIIQQSIYSVCIYISFKYMNVKVDLYLERSGASRVVVGCRCAIDAQSLKDLGKFIHHCVPLFLEGLLEQYFDRISYSLIFLFVPRGRPWGFARLFLQRFNQIDS